MPLSFVDLSPSQKLFVTRVCADLQKNIDPAQLVIMGDGSASPNGEKFVAQRIGCSWTCIFDFGPGALIGEGGCYETSVQLPSDWIADWKKQQMENAQ